MNIQAMRDELARYMKSLRSGIRGLNPNSYYAGALRGFAASVAILQRHTRPERFNKGEE